jgi:hypothetical protein
MLTAVAVIGILAAMAVFQISRVRAAAEIAKDQKNAQQIVSMYHSARAMGVNFDGANKKATIANVIAGGVVRRGVFEGTFFGLPQLSVDEQDRAAIYIDVAGEALQYLGNNRLEE